jgi:hypothetical protein
MYLHLSRTQKELFNYFIEYMIFSLNKRDMLRNRTNHGIIIFLYFFYYYSLDYIIIIFFVFYFILPVLAIMMMVVVKKNLLLLYIKKFYYLHFVLNMNQKNSSLIIRYYRLQYMSPTLVPLNFVK